MLTTKEPEAVPVWAFLRMTLLGIQNHMIVNLHGHGYLANARTYREGRARSHNSCSHLRTSKSLGSELHLKLGLCEERAN